VLQVVAGDDGLALVDGPAERFVVAHREGWLTGLLRLVSDLGAAGWLLPLVVAGLAWRPRSGSWPGLGLLATASAGAWALQVGLKALVHRPRPPAALALSHATGFAFPSGHATDAAAVYGMLAALVAVTTPRWGRKVAVWTAAATVAPLVGLSRVYLGVHWLTDITAGAALGAAWLFALLAAVRTVSELRARAADPPAGRPPDRSPANADVQAPRPGATLLARPPLPRRPAVVHDRPPWPRGSPPDPAGCPGRCCESAPGGPPGG
jgi:membrane-associated phospholipid phosphatase